MKLNSENWFLGRRLSLLSKFSVPCSTPLPCILGFQELQILEDLLTSPTITYGLWMGQLFCRTRKIACAAYLCSGWRHNNSVGEVTFFTKIY